MCTSGRVLIAAACVFCVWEPVAVCCACACALFGLVWFPQRVNRGLLWFDCSCLGGWGDYRRLPVRTALRRVCEYLLVYTMRRFLKLYRVLFWNIRILHKIHTEQFNFRENCEKFLRF